MNPSGTAHSNISRFSLLLSTDTLSKMVPYPSFHLAFMVALPLRPTPPSQTTPRTAASTSNTPGRPRTCAAHHPPCNASASHPQKSTTTSACAKQLGTAFHRPTCAHRSAKPRASPRRGTYMPPPATARVRGARAKRRNAGRDPRRVAYRLPTGGRILYGGRVKDPEFRYPNTVR